MENLVSQPKNNWWLYHGKKRNGFLLIHSLPTFYLHHTRLAASMAALYTRNVTMILLLLLFFSIRNSDIAPYME